MISQSVLLVRREMGELLEKHLTLLAESARDQRDLCPLVHVFGQGRPGADCFVVGVRVHEEKSSIHDPTLPCRAE